MTVARVILLLLSVPLLRVNAAAALREVREVHFQMGTFLEITLWHEEPTAALQLIRNAVREAHRLETMLSNYDPDSALSRLNRRAGAGKMHVPAELFDLLARCRDLGTKSDGLFDVTVGPLMELWQGAAQKNHIPSVSQLRHARSLVNYRDLSLEHPQQAGLTRRGMTIDLGGVGKGYAVDRLTKLLKTSGVRAALINFGGSSMSAIGVPPGRSGWKIALQDTEGHLRGAIRLRDTALSTSGAMGRWWIIDGKKYGHLIDPLSGVPISEPRMATVISPSATLAEALTKPLVLIGRSAIPIIERFANTAAVVIPEKGPPSFSGQFRNQSSWIEIAKP